MLFREQLTGEIHEFSELQHAELAACGDGAYPTQGSAEMLLDSQRGLRLGVEEFGEGRDEGVLEHVGSKDRVVRNDQRRQAFPVSLVEPDYVAHR